MTDIDVRLCFIGGGNMASSIIGGLVSSGWQADHITVADPSDVQRRKLESETGVRCTHDNAAAVEGADVVIWAVKPQVLQQAVESIAARLADIKPMMISIAAGIPASSTISWAGTKLPLVRVMPNTPALIGKGVSGLFATDETSESQRQLATSIMRAVGEVVWVDNEQLIDAVTGVSGSGPAYFFKLMELMIEEGIAAGLDPANARKLVVETGIGAASLLQHSDLSAAELRRQVTSPNGTTQAGIEAMEAGGIDEAVRRGVRAAISRSEELSNEFGGN